MARGSLDVLQELENKVKKLCEQVEKLSGKCLDLEGCLKRQNFRVAGRKEGKENGQNPRDFIAQMLKEALNLEESQ